MDGNFGFLNFDGLDDVQVLNLKEMIHPSNYATEIEFPWDDYAEGISKGNISSLNVHAPAFQLHAPLLNNHTSGDNELQNAPPVSYANGMAPTVNDAHFHPPVTIGEQMRTLQHQSFANGPQTLSQNTRDQQPTFSQHPKPFDGGFYPTMHETQQITPSVSTFKLNPTVSCFIPQNMVIYPTQPQQPVNGLPTEAPPSVSGDPKIQDSELLPEQSAPEKVTQNGLKQPVVELNEDALNVKDEAVSAKAAATKAEEPPQPQRPDLKDEAASAKAAATTAEEPAPQSKPGRRSWADIVSKGQKPAKVSFPKPAASNNETAVRNVKIEQEKEILLLAEDKMSLLLGKHLHEGKLDFRPVLLQPRGLINRRNWCYINACLQALLACSPFYTLLRDLPLGPGVDRGKSSTPVIDSMVKVMYEFSRYDTSQEELQLGPPFQPDFMYDMLSDLKSDCLKGQQEDAEEFLSFILNGMHEEMVKIIKNYEKKTNIKTEEINGDVSDEGDDWQVIQVGSKNKGMVTRKVVEHRTPISDLLGGQIKSFLTTKTVKTASIQPFFTLQLDIQSDNVTSVSEALKEMTVKVPIQGYVCAKSKQEVEAFNHVALQKLPPILILHLKRFVYNKTGGCKKVMKKTDYPLVLDINKDIFSSDVKNENLRPYKLFAVMYHDGEEAVKGHYISDVYNHGSQTWIRCDDRSVTAVTEDQVLSHSPPRVPYLLFYQES